MVTIASDLETKGYTRNFDEFNVALMRPLREGAGDIVGIVRSTASCVPVQNPARAFELWNVLCFWLAMALLVLDLLLPFGFALAEILGAVSSYFAAYTLHFIFLRAPQRQWMMICIGFLVLYVATNLFAFVAASFLIIPALMSFARAAANAVLLFYAHQLFVRLEGGGAYGGVAAEML